LELHRALLIVALRMREVGQLPADALKDYAAKCVKPTQVHLSNPEHWHSVLVLARVIQEATPHKTLSSSPVPVPVVGTLRRPVGEHATGPPPSTPQAPSVPLPPGLRVGDSKLCLVDELPMKRLEDGDFHHVTHADQAHHDRLTRYRSAQNHVFQGATP